jgi:hypothetical protein
MHHFTYYAAQLLREKVLLLQAALTASTANSVPLATMLGKLEVF